MATQDATQPARGRPSRYALLLGVVIFLSYTLTVGITQYGFGVFITPLEDEFGWTRSQVSTALSFFAMSGLAALPVGWLLDRVGAKPVMAVSLSMLGVSLLLRPLMTELWHFYLLNALQFAAMPGAANITGARLVGIWFAEMRGRAMGLTAMGANFGGIVFSSLTAVLIDALGWQSTYLVYGLLFCLLVPVVLLIVHERPHVVSGQQQGGGATPSARPAVVGVTLAEALRSRAFYFVTISVVIAQLTYQAVAPQIVPHLENVGISRAEAAAALSVVALFGMSGKVVLGWFCERYPARYALMTSLGCQVLGLTILLLAGSSPFVWAFVPIFGFGLGSLGSVMPLLVQDTFGLKSFGTIFGVVTFCTLGAALIGPPLVGISFDQTGSYQLAFSVIAGLFLVAAAVVSFTRPLAGATRASPPIAVEGKPEPAR